MDEKKYGIPTICIYSVDTIVHFTCINIMLHINWMETKDGKGARFTSGVNGTTFKF